MSEVRAECGKPKSRCALEHEWEPELLHSILWPEPEQLPVAV